MELTLEEALQKAVEAHQAGQTREAERLYSFVLNAQPNHPDANHNMGALAVSVDKRPEALAYFKIALEADPSINQYWLSYIDALIKLGQLDDAKSLFNQAKDKGAKGEAFEQIEKRLSELSVGEVQSQDPDPPSEQLQPIISLYTQGHLQQALSEISQMLERFPNSAILYNIAGSSNVGLMQLDIAINSYKQALQIRPDFAEVYRNMGDALKLNGDLEAAIDSYKKAVLIKPDFAVAYNSMGIALNDKGDLKEAIDCYRWAISLKTNYANAHCNLGNALKDKGDLDGAIDSYKQAIIAKPDYADAYQNMGVALQNKGDLEAAINSYEQALIIKPNSFEAYNNMGVALHDKGDIDSAIGSYQQAIKINPDFAEAYNNIGLSMRSKGDLEAAIDSYKKAIKINPDYAEAYNNMGIALEKEDKLKEARELYKSALFQLPKVYEHPYAFYRGQIYQKIWDYDGSSGSNKQYFSQSGQDKIIHEVFFKDYTHGFFLELGAYDGITGSNCLFFEKSKNWDGIAIEASETQFVKLEKNRSCTTLKAVIGERVEEVEFVEVIQGLTQMSGINYENYSRSLAIFDDNRKNQIEKRTVITKTVDSILREGMVVDFMSIDIEGNEMGVLTSIDFEKYEFRVICVENNIPEKQNFNEFLSKKGFCFFDRVGVDEIYYNKKYFDVFK